MKCTCAAYVIFRGVTGYLKKLKEFLSSPAGRKTDSEDVKIKQIALRSTENLQVSVSLRYIAVYIHNSMTTKQSEVRPVASVNNFARLIYSIVEFLI